MQVGPSWLTLPPTTALRRALARYSAPRRGSKPAAAVPEGMSLKRSRARVKPLRDEAAGAIPPLPAGFAAGAVFVAAGCVPRPRDPRGAPTRAIRGPHTGNDDVDHSARSCWESR